MEEKELDQRICEAVQTAMKVRTEEGHVTHHFCWKKRLTVVVVIVGGLWYTGHLMHWEELGRGWEFVIASAVDKLIFGIAEA